MGKQREKNAREEAKAKGRIGEREEKKSSWVSEEIERKQVDLKGKARGKKRGCE